MRHEKGTDALLRIDLRACHHAGVRIHMAPSGALFTSDDIPPSCVSSVHIKGRYSWVCEYLAAPADALAAVAVHAYRVGASAYNAETERKVRDVTDTPPDIPFAALSLDLDTRLQQCYDRNKGGRQEQVTCPHCELRVPACLASCTACCAELQWVVFKPTCKPAYTDPLAAPATAAEAGVTEDDQARLIREATRSIIGGGKEEAGNASGVAGAASAVSHASAMQSIVSVTRNLPASSQLPANYSEVLDKVTSRSGVLLPDSAFGGEDGKPWADHDSAKEIGRRSQSKCVKSMKRVATAVRKWHQLPEYTVDPKTGKAVGTAASDANWVAHRSKVSELGLHPYNPSDAKLSVCTARWADKFDIRDARLMPAQSDVLNPLLCGLYAEAGAVLLTFYELTPQDQQDTWPDWLDRACLSWYERYRTAYGNANDSVRAAEAGVAAPSAAPRRSDEEAMASDELPVVQLIRQIMGAQLVARVTGHTASGGVAGSAVAVSSASNVGVVGVLTKEQRARLRTGAVGEELRERQKAKLVPASEAAGLGLVPGASAPGVSTSLDTCDVNMAFIVQASVLGTLPPVLFPDEIWNVLTRIPSIQEYENAGPARREELKTAIGGAIAGKINRRISEFACDRKHKHAATTCMVARAFDNNSTAKTIRMAKASATSEEFLSFYATMARQFTKTLREMGALPDDTGIVIPPGWTPNTAEQRSHTTPGTRLHPGTSPAPPSQRQRTDAGPRSGGPRASSHRTVHAHGGSPAGQSRRPSPWVAGDPERAEWGERRPPRQHSRGQR